jgi:hypothetical protein
MSVPDALIRMLRSDSVELFSLLKVRITDNYAIVHFADIMTAVHVTVLRDALQTLTNTKPAEAIGDDINSAIKFWAQVIHGSPDSPSLFSLPIFYETTGMKTSTSAVLPFILWNGDHPKTKHALQLPNVDNLSMLVISNLNDMEVKLISGKIVRSSPASSFTNAVFAKVDLNRPDTGWSKSFTLEIFSRQKLHSTHIFTNTKGLESVPFILDSNVTTNVKKRFAENFPQPSEYLPLWNLFKAQRASAQTRHDNVMSTRRWNTGTGLYYRCSPTSTIDLIVIPVGEDNPTRDYAQVPNSYKISSFGNISASVNVPLGDTAPLLIVNSSREAFTKRVTEMDDIRDTQTQLQVWSAKAWSSARQVAVLYDIQFPRLIQLPTNQTPVAQSATLGIISAWRELARTLGPVDARHILTRVFDAPIDTAQTVASTQMTRMQVTFVAIPIFVNQLKAFSPVVHNAEQAALALDYKHTPRTDEEFARLGPEDGHALFLFTLQIILDMLCGRNQTATLRDMAIYTRIIMGMTLTDATTAEENTLEPLVSTLPHLDDDDSGDDGNSISDDDDNSFHTSPASEDGDDESDDESDDELLFPFGTKQDEGVSYHGVVSTNAPFFVYPVRASREIISSDLIDKTNRDTAWQMMNGEFASKYDFVVLDAGGALGWIIRIAQILTNSVDTTELRHKFTLFATLITHNEHQAQVGDTLWLPTAVHNGISHGTKRLFPEHIIPRKDEKLKIDPKVYDTPLFHLEILPFT